MREGGGKEMKVGPRVALTNLLLGIGCYWVC